LEGQDRRHSIPSWPASPRGFLQFAYYHADLGAKFLRQLLAKWISPYRATAGQIVDWLAVGKFAIAIGPSASDIQAGMKSICRCPASSRALSRKAIYMRATPGLPQYLEPSPLIPRRTKVFRQLAACPAKARLVFKNHFMRIDPVFSLRATMLSWILASSPIGPSPVTNSCPCIARNTEICKAPIGVIDEAATR